MCAQTPSATRLGSRTHGPSTLARSAGARSTRASLRARHPLATLRPPSSTTAPSTCSVATTAVTRSRCSTTSSKRGSTSCGDSISERTRGRWSGRMASHRRSERSTLPLPSGTRCTSMAAWSLPTRGGTTLGRTSGRYSYLRPPTRTRPMDRIPGDATPSPRPRHRKACTSLEDAAT